METSDLDAYFARIGHTGPSDATLHTLHALHWLHPQAIPFENLNPLLGWPVALDLASLQSKLVQRRRGGYCFEHNLLFMQVLRSLGFDVRGLAARVLWRRPEDTIGPRSHMVLLLELDGQRWIADVGFGGLTLSAPLKLEANLEQPTPHETMRLVHFDDGFLLQARLGDEWKALYRFDLASQHLPDYEVSSWYLSHHPASAFVNNVIAARVLPDGRLALGNNVFTEYARDGSATRRTLRSADELHAVLAERFGIDVALDAEVHAALARVIAAS